MSTRSGSFWDSMDSAVWCVVCLSMEWYMIEHDLENAIQISEKVPYFSPKIYWSVGGHSSPCFCRDTGLIPVLSTKCWPFLLHSMITFTWGGSYCIVTANEVRQEGSWRRCVNLTWATIFEFREGWRVATVWNGNAFRKHLRPVDDKIRGAHANKGKRNQIRGDLKWSWFSVETLPGLS